MNFDYKVGSFHHGVEAYKIADTLAEKGVCGALWADWWGFKMEAYDGIQENIAIVDRPQGKLCRRAFGQLRRHSAFEPGGCQGDEQGKPGGYEYPT